MSEYFVFDREFKNMFTDLMQRHQWEQAFAMVQGLSPQRSDQLPANQGIKDMVSLRNQLLAMTNPNPPSPLEMAKTLTDDGWVRASTTPEPAEVPVSDADRNELGFAIQILSRDINDAGDYVDKIIELGWRKVATPPLIHIPHYVDGYPLCWDQQMVNNMDGKVYEHVSSSASEITCDNCKERTAR